MTNIFKIDTPIRRSLYFVISTLVTIAVVIEGQVISPWTIDVLNNNTILINIIEVSIYLFFTYIYFTTDSKRIWQICGSKQLGIVTAACACFVKVLNDVLFYFKIIDVQIGMIFFGLLFIYYLFILFLPKDSLVAFVADMSGSGEKNDNKSEDSESLEGESSSEEENAETVENIEQPENSENDGQQTDEAPEQQQENTENNQEENK